MNENTSNSISYEIQPPRRSILYEKILKQLAVKWQKYFETHHSEH